MIFVQVRTDIFFLQLNILSESKTNKHVSKLSAQVQFVNFIY